MEDTIVLYPCPGRGHLVAMLELANHLLTQKPSFSITIIISPLPFEIPNSATEFSATTNPAIMFHHLPPTSLTKTYSFPSQVPNLLYDLAKLTNPKLHETLLNISKTSIVKALVIDFFNTSAFQVSKKLKIPTYYFFTSGTCGLAMFLYFPTIHKKTSTSLKYLHDFSLEVPGLPPVPSDAMPIAMLDRTTEVYDYFMKTAVHLGKSDGVIVNSFQFLEQRAIDSVLNGDCTPGEKPPPVYCIGPVLENVNNDHQHDVIINWLNSQPSRSVVFLCFGSMGVFNSNQLNEIAVALEKINATFLWVVRKPPQEDDPNPSVESILPLGFVTRTKEKGLVVTNWAPQIEVLSHNSVGAFVTHCGWNSILESVRAGVPMLAWPLYAEQKLNRVFLVSELKVALWVTESESDGLVSASELGERLTELFETEKGREVRRRVGIMRDEAVAAIREGGTSIVALKKLIESIKRGASE